MSSETSDMIALDVDWWLEYPADVIEKLQKTMATGVSVDASGSGPVPAQVAQLLIAAKATADAQGVPFSLNKPSEAATRSLSTLGVFDHLMDIPQ